MRTSLVGRGYVTIMNRGFSLTLAIIGVCVNDGFCNLATALWRGSEHVFLIFGLVLYSFTD